MSFLSVYDDQRLILFFFFGVINDQRLTSLIFK